MATQTLGMEAKNPKTGSVFVLSYMESIFWFRALLESNRKGNRRFETLKKRIRDVTKRLFPDCADRI